MSRKKICIITGSRAEYGLLYPLMKALQAAPDVYQLQLLVTGMHLSPEFGLTYQQIEKDGFAIDEKVEMLLSADTDTAIIKSTGLGMIGFADALARLKPDVAVILGDRFEAFAAATAAYLLKIPIAHLHGGELTEGASDDALRHAITKMSYLHFTSTEAYRLRVIQLGEAPERVFAVGAIGLDNIRTLKLLSKEDLEASLDFSLAKPVLVVTYHPVTLEHQTAAAQMDALLRALDGLPDYNVIFTLPNADADGRIIAEKIHAYATKAPQRVGVYTSLGQLRYLSLLQYAVAVAGNSSSGIIEAPSFGIPTVDIGDRQKGRVAATSVIRCDADEASVAAALKTALRADFRQQCKSVSNPYGDGHTTEKVLAQLALLTTRSIKKAFHDIQPQA